MNTLQSFKDRISNRFDQLTKSEKKIASYLMDSYEEAAFISAAEVASRLGISEATVVRFAAALGYSGYPELRRQLQGLVQQKVTHATRLRKKMTELSPDAHLLDQVMAMELEYLAEATHSVSKEAFDEAVRLICGARRVFVYALSGSSMLATLLEHRLRRFGLEVIPLIQSGREVCEPLLMLDKEDVFFTILFFRLSDVIEATVTFAKEQGCPVILLTDTLGPSLQAQVDVMLEARRGPVMAFHSLTVPMAIIQALILAVAKVEEEKALATLDRLDTIRERLNFTTTVKV